MKIVYLGSGDIGLPAFEWLLASPEAQVVGVVTQPDRPSGRGLQVKPCAIKEATLRHGLVPLQPAKIRAAEAVAQLAALEADLFVVMAYGQILPRQVLDLPRLGAINLHASLLPRHRGAAPVHAAVLAGDRASGITVMWMDEGLDTGDVLLREECEIRADDTAGSLHDRLAQLAPVALARAIRLIAEGSAPRVPQDESEATYAPKLDRARGRWSWDARAEELDRRIRGLHPWPGCTAVAELENGKRIDLKVHRAAVREGSTPAGDLVEGLCIGCGGGGRLEL
ncbi:MAG: methionyl-tRNA formyltransferase, partial [Chthoniobacterales bacterium]